jgi:hypothetical protein
MLALILAAAAGVVTPYQQMSQICETEVVKVGLELRAENKRPWPTTQAAMRQKLDRGQAEVDRRLHERTRAGRLLGFNAEGMEILNEMCDGMVRSYLQGRLAENAGE